RRRRASVSREVLLRRGVELAIEVGAEGVGDDALAGAVHRVVLRILVDEAGELVLVRRILRLVVEEPFGGARVYREEQAILALLVLVVEDGQRPQRAAERLVHPRIEPLLEARLVDGARGASLVVDHELAGAVLTLAQREREVLLHLE